MPSNRTVFYCVLPRIENDNTREVFSIFTATEVPFIFIRRTETEDGEIQNNFKSYPICKWRLKSGSRLFRVFVLPKCLVDFDKKILHK